MSIPSHGLAAPCLLVLLSSLPTLAEPAAPALVLDLAPGVALRGIEPNQITAAGGRLYFVGRDPAHGLEPWTCDGAGPPRRLGDLRRGTEGSNPGFFTELGDAVVFHAFDASGSSLIYRHAGDDVEEIARVDSPVERWARVGSLIYFITGDRLLFSTDGTRAGTRQVADLDQGAGCPSYLSCLVPEELASFEGALYFTFGDQLLRLPEGGTPQPIFALGHARDFASAAPGRLVFQACQPGSFDHCGAYATDGTAAGTRALEPVAGSTLTAGAHGFLAWRGRVYFAAFSPATARDRIVSTDGTPAGTRPEGGFAGDPVSLLAATPGHLFYHGYLASGGHTFFAVDAAGIHRVIGPADPFIEVVGQVGERLLVNQYEAGGIAHPGHYRLQSTNGDPGGSFDLLPDTAETGSALLDGRLYFSLGGQLWQTDGSATGTRELSYTMPFPESSWPRPIAFGAGLLAEIPDPATGSSYLWRIDPASFAAEQVDPRPMSLLAAGRQVAYLRESPYSDSRFFAYAGGAVAELPISGLFASALAADDHLFFLTETFAGLQFWESDGSAGGTRLRADLGNGCSTSGGYCSHQAAIAASGDHVFLHASGDGGRLTLWDRARNEKRTLLSSFELGAGLLLPLPGGRVAFLKNEPDTAKTWWTSDGTVEGTQPFFTLPSSNNLLKAVVAGDRIFFQLDSLPEFRKVLWVSDLTAAGTRRLFAQDRFYFGGLTAAGRNVFFAAESEDGSELGFSDGTPEGTRILDLRPGPAGSYPASFLATADGRLVFAAAADDAGNEAWISDGSRAGSYRLTDLDPGGASSPAYFVEAGDRLFFQATDGASGFELWALELPPRRTRNWSSIFLP